MRTTVGIVLLAITLGGVAVMALLRLCWTMRMIGGDLNDDEHAHASPKID